MSSLKIKTNLENNRTSVKKCKRLLRAKEGNRDRKGWTVSAKEIYCVEGSVWLQSEGKRVRVAKGTIVAL